MPNCKREEVQTILQIETPKNDTWLKAMVKSSYCFYDPARCQTLVSVSEQILHLNTCWERDDFEIAVQALLAKSVLDPNLLWLYRENNE